MKLHRSIVPYTQKSQIIFQSLSSECTTPHATSSYKQLILNLLCFTGYTCKNTMSVKFVSPCVCGCVSVSGEVHVQILSLSSW